MRAKAKRAAVLFKRGASEDGQVDALLYQSEAALAEAEATRIKRQIYEVELMIERGKTRSIPPSDLFGASATSANEAANTVATCSQRWTL